jgi:hypothetical protein
MSKEPAFNTYESRVIGEARDRENDLKKQLTAIYSQKDEYIRMIDELNIQSEKIIFELSSVNAVICKLDPTAEKFKKESLSASSVSVGGVTRTRKLISDEVEFLLRDRFPLKTPLILEFLSGKGIKVPGQDPSVYLANILSTDPRFVARRRFGGWFLTEQDPAPKKENPSATNTEVSIFNQASLEVGTESDGLI